MTAMWITEKLNLCAAVRLSTVMAEREQAGKTVVAPATAKAVLWSMVNYTDDDGVAWPSLMTLAEDAETSKRTVQRVIEILAEHGILSVQNRTRGEAAGSKSEDVDGATNLYRIDWDELEKLACPGRRFWRRKNAGQRGTRKRSGESSIPPDLATEKTRDSVASDVVVAGGPVHFERVPSESGTGANGEQNGCQMRDPSKEGNQLEPKENHPLTPKGEQPGGETSSEQPPPEPQCIRHQAEAIADAYPSTKSDIREWDVDAGVRAITSEFETAERVTWQEIRDASLAVRRMELPSPVYLRTWLGKRGYFAFVIEQRRRSSQQRVPVGVAFGASADRDLGAIERAERDAALNALDDAALQQLAVDTLAADTEWTRRHFAGSDPRTRPGLRILMFNHLQRAGARELVPA